MNSCLKLMEDIVDLLKQMSQDIEKLKLDVEGLEKNPPVPVGEDKEFLDRMDKYLTSMDYFTRELFLLRVLGRRSEW